MSDKRGLLTSINAIVYIVETHLTNAFHTNAIRTMNLNNLILCLLLINILFIMFLNLNKIINRFKRVIINYYLCTIII